tara:strand:- start:224 stop:451 length:228 start_codon:yes stop_codon:yes gene_type:complete
MFSLHDERVVVRLVPVQHDALVRGKLEQHVRDATVFIQREDRIVQMFEIAESVPRDNTVIEYMLRHSGFLDRGNG